MPVPGTADIDERSAVIRLYEPSRQYEIRGEFYRRLNESYPHKFVKELRREYPLTESSKVRELIWMMQECREQLLDPTESRSGTGTTDAGPGSPSGFLGGSALANTLGIDATRRNAFFQQLGRIRKKLGDDNWHEVQEPRPNSPRFIYRVDSPSLHEFAAPYKKPKPA